MNVTKPKMQLPQRWARLCWIYRTSYRWPEWCTPVPQVSLCTVEHWQYPILCQRFAIKLKDSVSLRCLRAKEHDLHEPSGNLGRGNPLQNV